MGIGVEIGFETVCVKKQKAKRVFHKFSIIQECQYCQLHFSCVITKELDEQSLQP